MRGIMIIIELRGAEEGQADALGFSPKPCTVSEVFFHKFPQQDHEGTHNVETYSNRHWLEPRNVSTETDSESSTGFSP